METARITDPFLKEMLNNVSKQSAVHGHSLEFLEGALEWLMTFTRTKLTEKERVQYLAKLSTYPKWKLMKLDEFNDSLSRVFVFLDALRQEPERFKALPEPDRAPRSIEIARDFNAHIQKWCSGIGRPKKETPEARRKRLLEEQESYRALDRKYPDLHVMEQVASERRFLGL